MESKDFIEIYKLHVELTDRISQRRGQSHQFYTTILSSLTGVIGYLKSDGEEFLMVINLLGFTGLLISLIWLINISSYKQINAAKFKTLHEMEERLTFPFFSKEYENLKQRKFYLSLSTVEYFTPVLFFILFLCLIIIL